MGYFEFDSHSKSAWNVGRKVGPKRALKQKEVWVSAIGLKAQDYGTQSLRRTKAAMIYKQAGNLRAVQILLGHAKIESTVRY